MSQNNDSTGNPETKTTTSTTGSTTRTITIPTSQLPPQSYVNTRQRYPQTGTQVTYSISTPFTTPSRLADTPPEPQKKDSPPIFHDLNSTLKSERPIIYNMHNLTNLKSWNIKFNGDTCVYDFLTRVEEMRAAKDVDIEIVLRGFSEFLQGTALQFYRQIKNNITSWEDICSQFKNNFQPVDFEYKTEKVIRTTYQQRNQTVFAYITHIRDLNSKLMTPISDSSLLEIIKHNLLPDYAPLLANNTINSIEQLITLSRNYEAYSKPTQESRNHPDTSHSNRTTNYNNTDNNKTPNWETCRKCNRRGHNYKQCRTVKGILCFKCGNPNVLTHSCPKCNRANQQKSHTTMNKDTRNQKN